MRIEVCQDWNRLVPDKKKSTFFENDPNKSHSSTASSKSKNLKSPSPTLLSQFLEALKEEGPPTPRQIETTSQPHFVFLQQFPQLSNSSPIKDKEEARRITRLFLFPHWQKCH